MVLTKEEHEVFTKAWREKIGYITDKVKIRTDNATKQDVIKAAKEIYANHPEILKQLKIKR